MKRIARYFLASLVIAPLLLVSPSAPARPQTAEAAPQTLGDIVLVARDLVDIKWEPAQYPQPQLQFLRWELYRGSEDSETFVAEEPKPEPPNTERTGPPVSCC